MLTSGLPIHTCGAYIHTCVHTHVTPPTSAYIPKNKLIKPLDSLAAVIEHSNINVFLFQDTT